MLQFTGVNIANTVDALIYQSKICVLVAVFASIPFA
jgi:hypothetical protein